MPTKTRSLAPRFNNSIRLAQARVEAKYVPKLVAAYERSIRKAGTHASERFALTAAAEWQPPAEGALLTTRYLQQLVTVLNDELLPLWAQAILDTTEGALATVEISWDVADPVPRKLLDAAARRTGARLDEAVQFTLRDTIRDAWDKGLSVRDASALIQQRISEAAVYQADMLARTDLNSLGNGASKEAARQAGMGYKTWLATLDDRTRPEHVAADGQTVPIGDMFTVGGEEADYPGDPNLSDDMACNCRCSVAFGETLDEAEGLLADAGRIIMAGMATKDQRKRRYERRAAHAKPKKQREAKIEIDFSNLSEDETATLVSLLQKTDSSLVAGAVAVHHTSVVGGTWDGNAAMGRASSAADYRSICAWFQNGADLDQRQSWKFPHHATPGGPANIAGVRNALSRLPQADIPAGDRAGVEAHLRAHLNDFNRRQGDNAIENFEALSTDDAVRALDDLLTVDAGWKAEAWREVREANKTSDETIRIKSGAPTTADLASDERKLGIVASPRPIGFDGTAMIEGKIADDNTLTPRVIMPNSITWPEMPVSFLAQIATAEGHDGAEVAGRVDEFARRKSTGRMRDITLAGELTNEFGINEIAPMIADKTMRYVSADLGATEWAIVNRNTLEEVPEEDLSLEDLHAGVYALACTSGKMKAVTLVATQAIEGALVSLTASAETVGVGIDTLEPEEIFALVASGRLQLPEDRIVRVVTPLSVLRVGDEALTAAAAWTAPPKAWFDMPELPGKMPLTITKEGRVYGHLATWDSCHASFLPSCLPPPHSPSNYARFHTGELDTAEGDTVSVGKLMFSPTDGGHADRSLSASKASQYYDRTGMAAAFLHATDGKHGIWVAGALNPRLDAEQREEMRRELRLNPPSGDWRIWDGQYDLLCGIAVAIPGFGIERGAHATVTITASAEGVELSEAIIASSGLFDPDPEALYAAEQMGIADADVLAEQRMRVLAARAEGMDALAGLVNE